MEKYVAAFNIIASISYNLSISYKVYLNSK